MKVLVTGGAGSIGLEVARKLIEEGHDVTVLDLAEQIERITIPEATKVFKGSILLQSTMHSGGMSMWFIWPQGWV